MLNSYQKWKDKVAVITGAANGIGHGLAVHSAGLGMKLVLADINSDALENVVQSLSDTEVIAVKTDVSNLDSVMELAKISYEQYGRVDLLFNNAGIMATGFSWEIEPAAFQRTLDININGVLNGVRSFLPRMKEQSVKSRIINTASIGGLLSSPLMAPYSVSKFAVVAYSESLKAEVEMLGLPVAVSVLCPGPVLSDIFHNPLINISHPAAESLVEYLRNKMNKNGISPDELARRAFRDIENDNFWLIPQPEALKEGFQRRSQDILFHCK